MYFIQLDFAPCFNAIYNSIYILCKLCSAFQYMHLYLFIAFYAGLSIFFYVSSYIGLVLTILLYEYCSCQLAYYSKHFIECNHIFDFIHIIRGR